MQCCMCTANKTCSDLLGVGLKRKPSNRQWTVPELLYKTRGSNGGLVTLCQYHFQKHSRKLRELTHQVRQLSPMQGCVYTKCIMTQLCALVTL